MRRLVIVLALLLAACATTAQDQSARMRAVQADLDAALAAWQERVAQKYYPTSVAATQDLVSRYDDVYTRWGMTADPLSQALMSYSLALADRVDHRQITADAANRLLGAMRADMDREKQRIGGGVDAPREAAMLRWWSSYWTANRARYEGTPQRPIACTAGGPGVPVECT